MSVFQRGQDLPFGDKTLARLAGAQGVAEQLDGDNLLVFVVHAFSAINGPHATFGNQFADAEAAHDTAGPAVLLFRQVGRLAVEERFQRTGVATFQQRIELCPHHAVAGTRSIEVSGPLRRRKIDSFVKQAFQALPVLAVHAGSNLTGQAPSMCIFAL